jgi:hypothetical protein
LSAVTALVQDVDSAVHPEIGPIGLIDTTYAQQFDGFSYPMPESDRER